jgi:hypothetical protein
MCRRGRWSGPSGTTMRVQGPGARAALAGPRGCGDRRPRTRLPPQPRGRGRSHADRSGAGRGRLGPGGHSSGPLGSKERSGARRVRRRPGPPGSWGRSGRAGPRGAVGSIGPPWAARGCGVDRAALGRRGRGVDRAALGRAGLWGRSGRAGSRGAVGSIGPRWVARGALALGRRGRGGVGGMWCGAAACGDGGWRGGRVGVADARTGQEYSFCRGRIRRPGYDVSVSLSGYDIRVS